MGCEAVECDRNWKHGCSRRRFNFNTDIFDSLENHERKRGQYIKVSIFRYYGLSWSGCLECKNIKFLIVKKYLLNKISLKVKITAHELILFLRKMKGSFFIACCFDHRLLFLSCLLIISNVFLFFFLFGICNGKQTKQMVATEFCSFSALVISSDSYRCLAVLGPCIVSLLILCDYWIAL